MQEDVHTVLMIPGNWPTRADLIAALARQGQFLFAGDSITDLETQLTYSFDIHDRDEQLAGLIAFSGADGLDDDERERLARHTLIIFLIGPGGSKRAAGDMLAVASKLNGLGGIAVGVATSGAAHSAGRWYFMAMHRDQPAALFDAYITFAEQAGQFFSVGMHVFGLPDALLEGVTDPNEASELLQTFLLYVLLENPDLKDGQAFRVDPQSPTYRLNYGPSDLQEPDNLMYNPYGLWKLQPIAA